MVRIDAFGMPSEELIARIEAEAGVGNREIVVTTDSKESDSSIDINVVENDKGWEVRLEIGGADQVTLPHSNESSVPEDAVS